MRYTDNICRALGEMKRTVSEMFKACMTKFPL